MNIVIVWYQHDWGLFGRRYEMIARTWARQRPGDNLLVAEPPLNPWIWLKGLLAAVRERDRVLGRFWLERLRGLVSPIRQEEKNLWTYRPFLWWPFRSAGRGPLTDFSFASSWAGVEKFLSERGWKDPLLWAYPPHGFVRHAVGRWTGRVCADLVDDNTLCPWLDRARRADYEDCYERVLERASPVFSVSSGLLRRYAGAERQVTLIPNALPPVTEQDAWNPPLLPPGPRVCYAGRLDERINLSLLARLLKDHPRAQFVFIGSLEPRLRAAWRRLSAGGRVHRWGALPQRRLFRALETMDACILPHRVIGLTGSMDPLKVYSYIAAGKPVVATQVPMERDWGAWVRKADTAQEFSRALAETLARPPREPGPITRDDTWAARVDRMEACLAAEPAGAGRDSTAALTA
ncbi:MAG: glycosyltransferase [Elusimicrobiota bacterium]